MALEALADLARAKGTVRRIVEELGVHPEALRTWVKKAQIDQGTRLSTTTDEAQRIKEPALEVRELRRANVTLKSASACLSQRSVSAHPVDLVSTSRPRRRSSGPGRSARCSLAPESRSSRVPTTQPRPATHQPGRCTTRPSRRRYPRPTITSYRF